MRKLDVVGRVALRCLLGTGGLFAHTLQAQTMPNPATLDRVVVTARLQGVPAFELPASVDVVSLEGDSNRAGAGLSEELGGLSGVAARERQNYAQDTQLSIRGFGARSTFGVRGIRLYADGIPATMPDGQGQLSHFSLLAGDTLEVMRGPFSALYGNSSGGVVQLWSADGDGPLQTSLRATAGSNGTHTFGARLLGKAGDVGYNLALSQFDTDGWRDHSRAQRRSANLKLDFGVGERGKLDVIANAFDAPDAQDPLGLSKEQVRENPRQATSVATQYDTRKSVRQNQIGLRYVQPFGDGQQLVLSGYGGHRSITQYLAIPPSAQANPLHSGGVVAPDTDYRGFDARWSWRGELAGRDFEVTAGANADDYRQHRRGYENFVGDTLSVRGRLRRDERNLAANVDEFAQAWWQFAPRWSLLAGVRHSRVRLRNEDGFVTETNPDDSGKVVYEKTTPVAGITFAARDDLRFYLSAGRGFETPTFNELGYRADGGAGLAFDLEPSTSRNLELGGKWRGAGGETLRVALFRADSDDELAVARNVGGRSSYRNVGSTRRQGAEVAFDTTFKRDWDAALAYTWLDATFRDGFAVCDGNGCTVPSRWIAAGTRLPGTARQQFSARLQWRHGDWQAAVEALASAGMTANDAGTARAPGYGLLNLEASRGWRFDGQRLRAFARIDNVLDRAYIGSVIVNDGNGRYYEPGPGRTFLVGLQWDARR
jgi:iron complex outermembrane receptor protein